MTVTLLSSLCEHACARACVRACVCGGGFLDISIAGCAAETSTLISYRSRARKAYYSYLTPSAVARSVACKLRKQAPIIDPRAQHILSWEVISVLR